MRVFPLTCHFFSCPNYCKIGSEFLWTFESCVFVFGYFVEEVRVMLYYRKYSIRNTIRNIFGNFLPGHYLLSL